MSPLGLRPSRWCLTFLPVAQLVSRDFHFEVPGTIQYNLSSDPKLRDFLLPAPPLPLQTRPSTSIRSGRLLRPVGRCVTLAHSMAKASLQGRSSQKAPTTSTRQRVPDTG
jgi:hypothetical protein